MAIIGLLVALIWSVGLLHMWRRQTASIPFVSVAIGDRMIAIFWPMIYLIIPFAMIMHLLKGRGGKRPLQGADSERLDAIECGRASDLNSRN